MSKKRSTIFNFRPTKLFTEFFESEKAGGMILMFCTLVSLALVNSAWGHDYLSFFHIQIGPHPLEFWINDGLMAIFFLLVGLELEREIYIGELSNLKKALLPMFAALGGMIVPACIYLGINFGLPTSSGSGIPMATDIAFALGILSLLGKRVPASLKVFLTALAVIDDLGAIIVIAFFYTKGLVVSNLLISLGIFAGLLLLNRLKVKILSIYLIAGVFMWYFMLKSGVHATITGVLLAFAIPFQNGGEDSISYKLQHFLHKPVAFFILPLFALANTAILIKGNISSFIFEPYALGIFFGLFLGKPIGISLFSYLVIKLKICVLPGDIKFNSIIGLGFLGGIGFTMSIFITLLAFNDAAIINDAKLMILIASLCASIFGFFLLKLALKD